jgi:hypothetical protein
MSTNSVYSNTPAELGYGVAFPIAIGSGYYSIGAPTLTAATSTKPAKFTVTATAVTGKGQDKDLACRSFTVDSTGVQSAADSGAAVSTATCWN